jgi:hypothetical protein
MFVEWLSVSLYTYTVTHTLFFFFELLGIEPQALKMLSTNGSVSSDGCCHREFREMRKLHLRRLPAEEKQNIDF